MYTLEQIKCTSFVDSDLGALQVNTNFVYTHGSAHSAVHVCKYRIIKLLQSRSVLLLASSINMCRCKIIIDTCVYLATLNAFVIC